LCEVLRVVCLSWRQLGFAVSASTMTPEGEGATVPIALCFQLPVPKWPEHE